MEKLTKTASVAVNTKNTPVKKVIAKVENKDLKSIATSSATTIVAEIKEATEEIKDIFAEAVTEITETIDIAEGVEKSLNSFKELNAQLTKTAGEIMNEVKEVSTEIKDVATKGLKDITKKADFNESIEIAKVVVKDVNSKINQSTEELKKTALNLVGDVRNEISNNIAEIKESTNEIVTNLAENATEMKNTATKLANEAIENIKINERLNNVKTAVLNANSFALETSSNLIDGADLNGAKWMEVQNKAFQTGLKLVKNQEEILFSTLEAVKTQMGSTAVRFKKLFSNQ